MILEESWDWRRKKATREGNVGDNEQSDLYLYKMPQVTFIILYVRQ